MEELDIGMLFAGGREHCPYAAYEQRMLDSQILDAPVLIIPIGRGICDAAGRLQRSETFVGDGVDHLLVSVAIHALGRHALDVSGVVELLQAAEYALIAAVRERLDVLGCGD